MLLCGSFFFLYRTHAREEVSVVDARDTERYRKIPKFDSRNFGVCKALLYPQCCIFVLLIKRLQHFFVQLQLTKHAAAFLCQPFVHIPSGLRVNRILKSIQREMTEEAPDIFVTFICLTLHIKIEMQEI